MKDKSFLYELRVYLLYVKVGEIVIFMSKSCFPLLKLGENTMMWEMGPCSMTSPMPSYVVKLKGRHGQVLALQSLDNSVAHTTATEGKILYKLKGAAL